MSDSVQWEGQTLYAPLLACRPVRPQDYDPERLDVWMRIQGEVTDVMPAILGNPFRKA